MREAPSLIIIDALLRKGATVKAYDPIALNEAKHLLSSNVILCDDAITATKDADALLLVTEWSEFRLPDWQQIKTNMKGHVIFDGRNIYNGEELKEKGFEYYGIGIQ